MRARESVTGQCWLSADSSTPPASACPVLTMTSVTVRYRHPGKELTADMESMRTCTTGQTHSSMSSVSSFMTEDVWCPVHMIAQSIRLPAIQCRKWSPSASHWHDGPYLRCPSLISHLLIRWGTFCFGPTPTMRLSGSGMRQLVCKQAYAVYRPDGANPVGHILGRYPMF